MKKLNKEQIEKLHELIKDELAKRIRYTHFALIKCDKNKESQELLIEKYRKEWNEYNTNTIKLNTDEKLKRLYELETNNKDTLNFLKEDEIKTTFLIFKKLKDYEKLIKEIIELATKEKNEKVKIEIENQKINLELKKINLELKKKKLENGK